MAALGTWRGACQGCLPALPRWRWGWGQWATAHPVSLGSGRASWWLSGKEPTCQCSRRRFHPCVRKIPWRRAWHPTPVFLPGESHGQRDLVGCSQSTGPQSDTIKHAQQGPPRSTLPGGQLQWRDVQWLPSQTECSLPPASLCSSETDLGGVHSDQEGADPSPDRAVTTRGEALLNQSHPSPHRWDSGQDTQQHLYYKSRPRTKNVRPTRATTQGGSHTQKKKPSTTMVGNCFS